MAKGITNLCHSEKSVRIYSESYDIEKEHEILKTTFSHDSENLVGSNCHFRMTQAFTLAEVLITLGIIGVVAALTIPTLMQKTNEKETVSKVKKVYSVLSSSFSLAVANNGTPDKWNFKPGNEDGCKSFMNYILPYLKISKDCEKQNTGCVPDVIYKKLSGANHNNYASNEHNNYYKLILADGISMWIRTGNNAGCQNDEAPFKNVCAVVFFDINGGKGPNVIGKDLFIYKILKDKVVPNLEPTDDCNLNDTGFSCSSYILKNDNMNYLKE